MTVPRHTLLINDSPDDREPIIGEIRRTLPVRVGSSPGRGSRFQIKLHGEDVSA